MGVPSVTAGRILKGQLQGKTGEETKLAMDEFPHVGLSKVGHITVSPPQCKFLCETNHKFSNDLLGREMVCC